jgi:hypothetical protein
VLPLLVISQSQLKAPFSGMRPPSPPFQHRHSCDSALMGRFWSGLPLPLDDLLLKNWATCSRPHSRAEHRQTVSREGHVDELMSLETSSQALPREKEDRAPRGAAGLLMTTQGPGQGQGWSPVTLRESVLHVSQQDHRIQTGFFNHSVCYYYH